MFKDLQRVFRVQPRSVHEPSQMCVDTFDCGLKTTVDYQKLTSFSNQGVKKNQCQLTTACACRYSITCSRKLYEFRKVHRTSKKLFWTYFRRSSNTSGKMQKYFWEDPWTLLKRSLNASRWVNDQFWNRPWTLLRKSLTHLVGSLTLLVMTTNTGEKAPDHVFESYLTLLGEGRGSLNIRRKIPQCFLVGHWTFLEKAWNTSWQITEYFWKDLNTSRFFWTLLKGPWKRLGSSLSTSRNSWISLKSSLNTSGKFLECFQKLP